jgi:methionyl-tRNA formyltransferase
VLHSPPVKLCADALGLETVQPTKIRTPEFAAWVRDRQAELAVVLAYGRILPPAVLAATARGFVNLHASLLPRWRGAAPIQWAIVHGETETGISLMQMDEGCDTGPVYLMRRIPVGPTTTAGELTDALGLLAAAIVREELPRLERGELEATPQEHERATAAPLIQKGDGTIDWRKPARAVHDHVRGMTPWPSAFGWIGGKRFKVARSEVAREEGQAGPPGTVLAIDALGAEVACGSGTLRIVRGQLEGRKECDAQSLERGRCIVVGQAFGDAPASG